MNSGTADLDRDDGVQRAHGCLEWLEVGVVVGEDAEATTTDPETDTGVDVLLGGLEPGIALRLLGDEHTRAREQAWKVGLTCLKMWCRSASWRS